jgi:hypothetical protein
MPIPLGPYCAAGHLEEAGRAVPTHDLLGHAAGASHFVALGAPEQVLQREQAEVRSWGLGIEGLLVAIVFIRRRCGCDILLLARCLSVLRLRSR